jgi:hypothetical protein
MVCEKQQDKTDKYHDLYKPQNVLDFLMVCEKQQGKIDKYDVLHEPDKYDVLHEPQQYNYLSINNLSYSS